MWRFRIHTIVIDVIAENPDIHFNMLASKLKGIISRNILARIVRELKRSGIILESKDERHSQKILLRVSRNFQEIHRKISLERVFEENVPESVKRLVERYLSITSRYNGEFEVEYARYRLFKNILNLLPLKSRGGGDGKDNLDNR